MEKKNVNFEDVVYFQEGPGVRNWQFRDSGIKLINIRNLVDSELCLENTTNYLEVEEVENKYKHFLLNAGDFVMASSGVTWGKIAEVHEEHLPLCLNTSIIRLVSKDTDVLDKWYLYYYIKSPQFRRQIERLITGSAQPNFGPSHLKKVVINLPEICNQREAVEQFTKVEAVINKRQKEIELLDDLIKARFVEMFGDININDKNWDCEPLGDLCTIVRGGSPRPIEQFLDGDVPWIKIGDATDGDNIYLSSTKEHIIQEGVKKSRLVKSGSLIFANCGVSLGFARIITFDGCIHDGWLAMEDIDERLDKVFLLQALNQMTEHFRAIAPAGTQPNLNTAIMKAYKQVIPPIELQKEFIRFVEQVDKSKLMKFYA